MRLASISSTLLDLASVVAVLALALTHTIDGAAALAAILAVQAGRLYPRRATTADPPSTGTPSGTATLVVGLAAGAAHAFHLARLQFNPQKKRGEKWPVTISPVA